MIPELLTCNDCDHNKKGVCEESGEKITPYEPACWKFKLFNEPATLNTEKGAV